MGGINCGVSNNKIKYMSEYRLNYARYMQEYFKFLEQFSKANYFVEEFTIKEIEDTKEANRAYKNVLDLLSFSIESLNESEKYLNTCCELLRPLFKYDKIRDVTRETYSNIDALKSRELWETAGLLTSEQKVWNMVTEKLVEGGELEYLSYQHSELKLLKNHVEKLVLEFEKLEDSINLGVSYVSIRDLEVNVTPYTAMILSKISDVSSSITYLCLLEYSTHTSISGKELSVEDFIVEKTESTLKKDII
mgnify:CR=1 FL=1|jgi:hypothetical protein